ncbi:MAG: LptF/LptG family permease [Pelagibacterales bacterium]|nr:LptF/LptG family permease [Pelagibacterales bacterium]
MFSKINLYLYKNYLIGFLIVLFIFSLLTFTGDLIENFRKGATKDVPTSIIFELSLYNFPSLIYETIPIIIFFSCIFTTVKLIRTSEYTIFKSSGMTNRSLLISPLILFLVISILFVLTINPLVAIFHSKYDELNYSYIKKTDKFASISKNGVWLKQDNVEKKVSSILSSKTIEQEGEILNNFMILEYNQKGSFTGRLNGKRAKLENGYWILYDVTEYPRYSASKFHNELIYRTTIKHQDISNSLLSPENISIYQLNEFIKLIDKLGYSAIDHKLQYYGLLLLPMLVLSLVFLANSLTIRINHNDKIFGLLIISICTIFIYYFLSNLFNALSMSSQLNPLISKIFVPVLLSCLSLFIILLPKKFSK